MEQEKDYIVKIGDSYRECLGDKSFGRNTSSRKKLPAGFVEIYEVDSIEKEKKKLIEKSNLVVYMGREWLGSRIFNVDNPFISPTTASEFVAWFGLGTGGVLPADLFDPVPPTNLDTDLDTKIMINATDSTCGDYQLTPVVGFYKHPLDLVTYEQDSDNDNKYLIARVEVTINNDDANDNNLSEAGLYTASSASGGWAGPFHLYARVTFPTIRKTSSRQLLFVWYIYV